MSEIEQDYAQCIRDIADDQYTEDQIENCVGRNFLKVMLDIKYVNMKVMSRGDSTVREIMIDHCYIDAGEDEIKSNSCDLVERDILLALWKGLPFHKIMSVNTTKYMKVESEMGSDEYIRVLEQIQNFAAEFFELMDEVDSHKEVTLLRLKTLIDDRTRAIVQEAKMNPEKVQNKIINHQIEIT